MPDRRRFLLGLALLALAPRAGAAALDGISQGEALQALRESLEKGGVAALARLGGKDGFFADPQVKIGLPKNFAKAERFLRSLGHGKQVDALVLAMNRAAETAVPQAGPLVQEAVKRLEVADAKAVLSGGDAAATLYFRKSSEADLKARLLPLVQRVSESSDLARAYAAMSAVLVRLAGLKSELLTVEKYVSSKAADGIYVRLAEEERALRAHPERYAGGVLGKVFQHLQ